MVRIEKQKCAEIAKLLRKITIPPRDEGRLSGIPAKHLPNFYFLVVAICHQTSPVGGPMLHGILNSGVSRRGWDYLRDRLAERVTVDPRWIEPATWISMTAFDLEEFLADAHGKKTLTGASGRAALVRNMGSRCNELGVKDVTELKARCDGWIMGGPNNGLYPMLATFDAYRDPAKKKSSLFLELMRTECQWLFRDAEHIGVSVDYHEVRGHLRLGTITIEDQSLLNKIRERRNVTAEQDLAIRFAVQRAIEEICRQHGASQPQAIHYLFWNTFRSCCGRETQHCSRCEPDCVLPARFRAAFSAVEAQRCVFAACCMSAGKPDKLIEHQHDIDFY